VRIYKTRWVGRYTRREGIADKALIEAIERAEQGLIDADLGGGARTFGRIPHAHRLPKEGSGVFPLWFCKSERGNIEKNELMSLQEIGARWLGADAPEMARALGDHTIEEVEDGKQKEK
jgi:hypothetical protein